MSEQIFVGSKPKPSKIEPIEQLEDRSKPDTGGFWTTDGYRVSKYLIFRFC
jgi:hypothetical protein